MHFILMIMIGDYFINYDLLDIDVDGYLYCDKTIKQPFVYTNKLRYSLPIQKFNPMKAELKRVTP